MVKPGTRAPAVSEVPVVRVGADGAPTDPVVVEEPLEVRVGGESLLVTMRTPGEDRDLVRGLFFTEGLVDRPEDVVSVATCDDVPEEARGNVVVVALARGVTIDPERSRRATLTAASCGVCGKATLAAIRAESAPVADGPTVSADVVRALPGALAERQDVFRRTGGLHAAALFAPDGRLLSLKEDVGRHNAVDKVVGEAARFGRLPLSDALLMVSGRAGYEIVQKARRAGIPVVCSVSAPSSLSVALAVDGNQTLVGFLRDDRFNVYAGAERIAS